MSKLLLTILAAAVVAAAGAAGGAIAGSGVRTVELTVRHSRFDPATIDADPGETVRFVIRNLDPIDHELIVGPMPVQLRHEVGRRHHHGAIPGEISVPAGTVRSTTYTFLDPGQIPYGCHLPGHWAYGMRGSVRVG
jgi:uncharacterized cupredoxin-like copper-binding protein